ncbi:hypothetical protein G5714_004518 [Onychostoma macrolepis]|uniref:Uncharacterized protein n=1 Tax=Onychostoma macrolepis TaxID=369639 RepID=A0A7J6D5E6_9TELE|nr:hypothetical protein G5714_004518 [Onychostoma macrolepis]
MSLGGRCIGEYSRERRLPELTPVSNLAREKWTGDQTTDCVDSQRDWSLDTVSLEEKVSVPPQLEKLLLNGFLSRRGSQLQTMLTMCLGQPPGGERRERKEDIAQGLPQKRPKKCKPLTCSLCQQPKTKDYGHSQYGGKFFCSSYEGKTVELWLAEQRSIAAPK